MLDRLRRRFRPRLLEQPDERPRPRVGIVSRYNTRRGITTLARLHEFSLADQAEVFPAHKLTRLDASFERATAADVQGELRHPRVAPEGMRLLDFVARQDILIFIERPQPRLFEALRKSGKIVMLDVLLDWLPEERDDRIRVLSQVDHFLVHTRQARERLGAEYDCVHDVGAAHYWKVAEPRPVRSPKRFYFNIGANGPLDRRNVRLTLRLFHDLLDRDENARLVMKMIPRARKYLAGIPLEHPRIELIDQERTTAGMIELQKGMDVTLFPSRFEGLGFPLLESLYCGVPVITTAAPPMSEFVTHGVNGLHVDCTPHGRFGMQSISELDPDSYREQIASLLGDAGTERLASLKARSTEGLGERQNASRERTQALMKRVFAERAYSR